jgi:large subunit ribosomal protein L29
VSKTTQALTKMRDLPDDELRLALDRVRDELFRLQLGMQTNQVASTASVATKRREVAKILTVMRGRDLGLEQALKARAAKAAAAPEAKPKKTRKKKAAEE